MQKNTLIPKNVQAVSGATTNQAAVPNGHFQAVSAPAGSTSLGRLLLGTGTGLEHGGCKFSECGALERFSLGDIRWGCPGRATEIRISAIILVNLY